MDNILKKEDGLLCAPKSNRKRVCSLDIFRLICAGMVVAIHSKPLIELGETSPIYLFINNVLVNIAVPFFFAVSGFYFKDRKFSGLFRSVLIPYCIWSIPWLFIDVINYVRNGYSIFEICFNILKGFLCFGLEEYLWFVPALVFSAAITAFVRCIFKNKYLFVCIALMLICYFLGLIITTYYAFGSSNFIITKILNITYFYELRRIFFIAIPFFLSGFVVNYYIKLNKTSVTIALGVCLLLYIITGIFEREIIYNLLLLPIPSLFILFFIRYPCYSCSSFAKYARFASALVYYSHYLFIYLIRMLDRFVLHIGITGSMFFLCGLVIPMILALIFYKSKYYKYFSKIV